MHDSRKVAPIGNKDRLIKYKKPITNFILFVIILSLLLFPSFYGGLIGHWIKDFFGTMSDIVKTIN